SQGALGPSGVWGEPVTRPKAVPVPIRVPRGAARPRLRNPKTLSAAILALGLLAAAVYVARPGGLGRGGGSGPVDLGPAPPSVAWSLATSQGTQIAVVGTPTGRASVALALPSETHVILPAGD